MWPQPFLQPGLSGFMLILSAGRGTSQVRVQDIARALITWPYSCADLEQPSNRMHLPDLNVAVHDLLRHRGSESDASDTDNPSPVRTPGLGATWMQTARSGGQAKEDLDPQCQPDPPSFSKVDLSRPQRILRMRFPDFPLDAAAEVTVTAGWRHCFVYL